MLKCEKKDISFKSSDHRSTIAGYVYTCSEVPPFCVVQISHGMCEYLSRYDDFACYLAQHGVAVCGNDHIGHGASAASPSDLGYFGRRGGRAYAIQDLKTMNTKAHALFPGVPVVLLGHSMGSFFARKYAQLFPGTIDGLILSGTGGPNALAGAAIWVADKAAALKGPEYRSKLVHDMAFGSYLKKIDSPKTSYDWISRDEEIVKAYNIDPYCTFRFTTNGFRELFSALRDVSSPEWAATLPKDMPMLMIQGDADPVGDYGKGTAKVRDWLLDAGVKELEYRVYPGGRHEMLNETNRAEVYEDVLAFLRRWWQHEAEPVT